jgi:leucyl-tRNA synthetase
LDMDLDLRQINAGPETDFLQFVIIFCRDKLAEAKELVYLKGFYEGKMLVGELVGKSVQEAKPLIKQQLLDRGQAVVYMEPEKTIISR